MKDEILIRVNVTTVNKRLSFLIFLSLFTSGVVHFKRWDIQNSAVCQETRTEMKGRGSEGQEQSPTLKDWSKEVNDQILFGSTA